MLILVLPIIHKNTNNQGQTEGASNCGEKYSDTIRRVIYEKKNVTTRLIPKNYPNCGFGVVSVNQIQFLVTL